MKNKILSTSIMAITFISPAMADYAANQSYSNSCNGTAIGVTSGTTGIATANFSPDTYNCTPGQYLAANTIECAACPTGSYCPNTATYTFNATTTQGAVACPNTHSSSGAKATSITQCYRACTTADISHATGISGNVYYNGTSGDGVKACVATSCDSGYSVDSGVVLSNTIGVTQAGTAYGRVNHSGTYTNGTGSTSQATYGISAADTFGVDYGSGKGIITGTARCSTQQGWKNTINNDNDTYNKPTVKESLTAEFDAEGAIYCYCQLDSYTPDGGTKQNLSAPWVLVHVYSSVANCTYDCSDNCGTRLRKDNEKGLAYRTAMFNAVTTANPSSCKANTITVQWGDGTTNGVHATNTCTYDAALTTPSTAPTKRGYTFTGWTFPKPTYDFSTLNASIEGTDYTYDETAKTWTTNFSYGDVSGVALCSVTSGSFATAGTPDASTTGETRYCWCKATGYTPANSGITYENTTPSAWVFYADSGSASDCASSCASGCGNRVRSKADFRRAVLGITQ